VRGPPVAVAVARSPQQASPQRPPNSTPLGFQHSHMAARFGWIWMNVKTPPPSSPAKNRAGEAGSWELGVRQLIRPTQGPPKAQPQAQIAPLVARLTPNGRQRSRDHLPQTGAPDWRAERAERLVLISYPCLGNPRWLGDGFS
jgi:hypothetical protein